MEIRKIIHIDMDAFYASVEQRNNPKLKGKPVAVGGTTNRGVIAAASYEARVYGVRSAMSSVEAVRLCPQLIFVKSNFEEYKAVSKIIRKIFHEFTDMVEPLSLDEAFLDVTHNKKDMPSATIIANEIRRKIFEETQLTCSAGISINKMLAKVASDYNKPNGFKLITPDEALEFIEKLPVKKFPYIGKVTSKKMYKLGIHTGRDLKKLSLEQLSHVFGKSGIHYYNMVRCIHNSPVKPFRKRKSVGIERTLEKDFLFGEIMHTEIKKLSHKLAERAEHSKAEGKTLTIKIKTSDFKIITRSATSTNYIKTEDDILHAAMNILEQSNLNNYSVRLVGLNLSNLKEEQKKDLQLTMEF